MDKFTGFDIDHKHTLACGECPMLRAAKRGGLTSPSTSNATPVILALHRAPPLLRRYGAATAYGYFEFIP